MAHVARDTVEMEEDEEEATEPLIFIGQEDIRDILEPIILSEIELVIKFSFINFELLNFLC